VQPAILIRWKFLQNHFMGKTVLLTVNKLPCTPTVSKSIV
jgi:hypothetical protein